MPAQAQFAPIQQSHQEEHPEYQQIDTSGTRQQPAFMMGKFSGANLSPLRGIKEQENEDISEITYRASAIYLKDEQPEQPIEIVS